MNGMRRRNFLTAAGAAGGAGVLGGCRMMTPGLKPPNVVFVFADQWRASATGYAGNPDVKTPHLDRLASESFRFKNAVSVCPVCSPARASIMTGQYPLTHGVFVNDVHLQQDGPSIAEVFNEAGYATGFIGKWHLDGHGRSSYIPPERRQGFGFWQVLECTHRYNDSLYYDNNNPEAKRWRGYDAIDQTRHAVDYIRSHGDAPFVLFLSWGPPHAPYLTAPEAYRAMYDPGKLTIPPNVPEHAEDFIPPAKWDEHAAMEPRDRVRRIMAGYYAHCSALDACIGRLQQAIRDAGLEEDTIFVFTADHGDMLGSHGLWKKQWPYDESVCVPFLLKYPGVGKGGRELEAPFNTPDIMPTLCELCGVPVPSSVEGDSFVPVLKGAPASDDAALIVNIHPFGQWSARRGGREWRGVRTARHTYVKDLNGPWLLFDNESDPYQRNNLVDRPETAQLQRRLERLLQRRLRETADDFADGMTFVRRQGYPVDETGTVQYEE
ncbi:sulfatase [Kiritimatiella glycovorans]|uniref:Arylsulfatase n=1 Tax=Kiritimatiella glycovorans TaxID=1307763 RepID=A0A0G3EIE0_9BACT|nr:sulfatase [Kiritimatiella glycovorans]AKJ64580.1 Arylsulfatase [Kiritimatiella glycovorans]